MTDAEIDALVQERELARVNRDWQRADELRERVTSIRHGTFRVVILDEPAGPFWYWTTRPQ